MRVNSGVLDCDSLIKILDQLIKNAAGYHKVYSAKTTIDALSDVQMIKKSKKLVELYGGPSPANLELFHYVITAYKTLSSVVDDGSNIESWIDSVSSATITSACKHLEDQIDVPGFVLVDILYRTPSLIYELRQLLKMFRTYFNLLSRSDRYYMIFHLIFQCQVHSYEDLEPLILFYLSNFQFIDTNYNKVDPSFNTRILCNFNKYTKGQIIRSHNIGGSLPIYQLNWLIWRLSDGGSLLNRPKEYHTTIIRCQNILVKFIALKIKLDPQNYLGLLGNLAIINSLQSIGNPQVPHYLKSVQEKYFKPLVSQLAADNQKHLIKVFEANNISYKNVMALVCKFYYVKILSAQDKHQLVEFSDEAFKFSSHFPSEFVYLKHDISHSSLLWRAFVEKLNQFGLLTPDRSELIIKKILAREFVLNYINVRIVNLLVRTLKDANYILKLIKYVNARQLMNPAILQNLIVTLYRAVESSDYKNTEAICSDYSSLLDYTRELVNSIANPDVSLVGQILKYESSLNPKVAFNLYNKLLIRNNKYKLIPDASCLLSLLNASLNCPDLVWGKDYAVQVSITEFKKWCLPRTDSSQVLVKPSHQLWSMYLENLHHYNYYDELNELPSWWELLHYIPGKLLLLHLLYYLPQDLSDRFRAYGYNTLMRSTGTEKVQSNIYVTSGSPYSAANWPWPTQYELDAFRSTNK